MTQEALKMALYYLEQSDNYLGSLDHSKPIAAIKKALAQIEQKQDGECKYCTDGCPACDASKLPAQTEQEPVAWLLTDKNINSFQVDSIQRLIDRARHAHMTDIKLRINRQDEWHQADWLKHLTRTTPPHRTWVGLTDDETTKVIKSMPRGMKGWMSDWDLYEFSKAIEAKLKEKNT